MVHVTQLGRWRIVVSAFLVVLVVIITVLALGGWYLSNELKRGALISDWNPGQHDLEVVDIKEGLVTLRLRALADENGPWRRDGIWGLQWDGGYAQVGAILEVTGRQVVREFHPLSERPDTGETVRLDSFAFPDDPRKAFGLPYEEVSFSSPLGDLAAWIVGGSSETWVIFVHGRNVSPREGLRILPTLVELGLPCLLITYRNDEGAPANPDGFHRHGQTEWKDLEGAVSYAIEHGAEDLILVGYSMGGAIVTNFLYESSLSKRVRGIILDAPMLNFNATIDLGASERNLPGPFVALAKFITRLRFGIDWGKLDYLDRADELSAPILLFHGDEDDIVPIETSDELARIRPDIVEYVRGAGVIHAASWNHDPAIYEAAVRDFILALPK